MVFNSTIHYGKNCPQDQRRDHRNAKRHIRKPPKLQIWSDQIPLFLGSWLKNLLVQLDHQLLENRDVANETVDFKRSQQICGGDEDDRSQSLQICVDHEDVRRLKEVMSVGEDVEEHERIHRVEIKLVNLVSFGPQTRDFQYHDVYFDGTFPIEFFHLDRQTDKSFTNRYDFIENGLLFIHGGRPTGEFFVRDNYTSFSIIHGFLLPRDCFSRRLDGHQRKKRSMGGFI
jgi:hypothetical protein